MVFYHLLRMSLGNLMSRFGRTVFLVIGVAVGTGTLAFLLALYQGLDEVVRANVEEHRAVLSRRADLSQKKNQLIGSLPVNRITVRPGREAEDGITRDQVIELRGLDGVRRVDPVAFLFPVIIGVKAKNFAVPGVPEKEIQREFKIPTTVYGMPPNYIAPGELLPGRRFLYDPPDDPDQRDVVPVVLPTSLLNFLTTLKSEEMQERFSEITYSQLQRAMERNPRVRENLNTAMSRIPGMGAVTDEAIKKLLRNVMASFLDQVNEENLPENFELTLYPGLEVETLQIKLQVVGYSDKVPGTGISVPLPYIERWNRLFSEETSGVLSRVFSSEPETTYSEVHLQTTGFEATRELHGTLGRLGYKVESAVEEAIRLEGDLVELQEEADRIQAESERIHNLSDTLSKGTVIFSVLLFLLAGAVIVNGLTLSVLEQQRRIGILRAVGARRTDILIIFLFEAAVVGAMGAALGLLASDLGLLIFGDRLSASLSGSAQSGGDLFRIEPTFQGAIFALGVLFSFVAGILPAMKAAWIRPVEVLKH